MELPCGSARGRPLGHSARRRRGSRTLAAAAAGLAGAQLAAAPAQVRAPAARCGGQGLLRAEDPAGRAAAAAAAAQRRPGRPPERPPVEVGQPAPEHLGATGRRPLAAAAAAVGLGLGSAGWLRRARALADTLAAGGAAASAASTAIEKAPLDPRTYTPLTLPNGLRVLLVSDPDGDRAAAAMDVHVGFFSDPEDLPGLAHFCEHMLFLGTEAFPEENSFDKYLTANSGFSNAFTDNEDTCFFFSCEASALAGGLERFGAFFQGPLFTAGATEREVNAIDSEHSKNLQDDGFRTSQILSSRANPAHPYHHFGTGNRTTLLELPAGRGIDLRAALIQHYRRYYRTPLMTLAVLGREPPAELARLAERHFGRVPGSAGPLPPPAAAWGGISPFLPGAFDEALDVVPAADQRLLEVAFPIPFAPPDATGTSSGAMTLDTWRRYSPSTHVGAVIGHEGPRSLCALLRKRGLATGLNAGSGEENETFAMLAISVELTEQGLARREEVLELLFGYLRLLRELPKWPTELLEENIRLSEAGWQTSERPPASDAVVQLVGNMQRYEQQAYVVGGARLRGGPGLPAAVATLLAALTPGNALLTALSRSFTGSARETEPWYGTRFGSSSVVGERAKWEAARPAPGLALPAPNPFLPRSLELKAARTKPLAKGVSPPPPSERRRDDRWRLLFRQEPAFGVPKAYICIELLTAFPRSSARAAVLSRLYEALLTDGLTEPLLYDARMAGLVFELTTSSRGVQLFFGGYDDRLVDFVRAAMVALRSFDPAADVARFEAQRDVLAREFASFAAQPPYQQAGYWTGLATTRPDFSVEELRAALGQVTAADVGAFTARLWGEERLYGFALCQGNLRPDEADAVVAAVDASLPFRPLPEAEWPEPAISRVPARPEGMGFVIAREAMDGAEENSAVEITFQAGQARCASESGRRRWAALQVLGAALRDRFYSELRTRQQLGYVVSSGTDRREGVVRFSGLVQGSSLDPLGMMRRIDTFLETQRRELSVRPDNEIRGIAEALAESRLSRPQQLGSAVERTLVEVKTREFQWERAVLEAAALRSVSRADVVEAFERFVAPGGAERRRLVTLIFGSKHRAEFRAVAGEVEALGGRLIADAKAFAAEQPSYEPGPGRPPHRRREGLRGGAALLRARRAGGQEVAGGAP